MEKAFLAEQIIGEKNDLNKINALLQQLLKPQSTQEKENSVKCLRKVFKVLILGKDLVQFKNIYSYEIVQKTQKIHENEGVAEFIVQKFQAFVKILFKLTFDRNQEEDFRMICLRTLVELSRYQIQNVQNLVQEKSMNLELPSSGNIILNEIVDNLIKNYAGSNAGEITIVLFEYSEKYYDFCSYYIQILANRIKNFQVLDAENNMEQIIFIENIISILQDFPVIENNNYDQTFYIESMNTIKKKSKNHFKKSEELELILKKRKNQTQKTDEERTQEEQLYNKAQIIEKIQQFFSNFIFGVIQIIKNQPEAETIFIKNVVQSVLNNMANPLIISDYFTQLFDSAEDCNLQVGALSSILVLIGKYGLEYPNFYHKLYQLIGNPLIFRCEEKANFKKMVEKVLKSQKVTMVVQASFMKKLLQMSLEQPPNTILWILAIVINTVKRNPTLIKMIDTKDLKMGVEDVFDRKESDIFNTNAENSFLWELKTLQGHYLSEVNKLIKVLGSNLVVANYLETEPFSDLQYADLMNLAFKTVQQKKLKFPVIRSVPDSQEINVINLDLFQ